MTDTIQTHKRDNYIIAPVDDNYLNAGIQYGMSAAAVGRKATAHSVWTPFLAQREAT